MKNKKQIENELGQLNENISWNEERQHHVKRRLIRGMEFDNSPSVSWIKRRLIPVLSLLLLFSIVTTIFLSEFTGQEVADKGNNPPSSNGDSPSQIVSNNENNNGDTNNQNERNNNASKTTGAENNEQTNIPEEDEKDTKQNKH